MGRGVVCLILFGCALGCPGARADSIRAVINEVLYDPVGSDGGHEFVEIFNGADVCISLEGWRLETGNGAGENRWKLEWTGAEGDTIPAHGFFVIGEDLVGAADVVTDLDLQNGPDGCRLISGSGGMDIVGWGDLVYAEYFEGTPVSEPGSGASIGRDPDGQDTNVNADDFVGLAPPTPGDFNHPPFDLTIQRAGLSRYLSSQGSEIDIACVIRNVGTQACGKGAMVHAQAAGMRDSTPIAEDMSPATSTRVAARLPHPGEGLHPVRIWLNLLADRWPANDSLSTSIMLRPSPVVINEIMFNPGTADCEWIEIFAHAGTWIDISQWTLEDHSGRRRNVAARERILPRGAYVVLVEDEEIFSLKHPDVDRSVVFRPAGGWPTLNDADSPLGFADHIVIRDRFGTMVDSVAYGAKWSRPETSIERIDPRSPSADPASWSPHYGTDTSSPGRQNSVSFYLPEDGRFLSICPQAFSPDGNGKDDLLAISIDLPDPCLVRLRIFDINGRPVAGLIDGDLIEASRRTFWDGTTDGGTSASMGAYLVALEAKSIASGRVYKARLPTIVIRR